MPTDLAQARFFSRRAGRWLSVPQAQMRAQLPCLDRPFTVPGSSRAVTLREVLDATRAAGVRPHCGGPDQDEELARRLSRLVRGFGQDSVGPGKSFREDRQDDEPEADLAPSDFFGVAEPACPVREVDERVWGRTDQIIGDLLDMGAGSIRRNKYRDIWWGSLFPLAADENAYKGSMVLAPADILEALRADERARLASFTELILACLVAGIRMSITPFDAGGGSTFNFASRGALEDLERLFPLADGNSWTDVFDNRPQWQLGIRVPSPEGWDPFYWDHDHGRPTAGERVFERFAIHVWPTREDDPGSSTVYSRECARRKSLGIAAFAQGVAEHLAALNRAWQRLFGFRAVTATIETVELGNELNGLFPVPPDTDDPLVLAAGQLEANRYMTLLAQPFRALLPGIRFKAAEPSSWHPSVRTETRFNRCLAPEGCCVVDNYAARVEWLRDTIGVGVTGAHRLAFRDQQRWASYVNSGGATTLPDSTREWVLSCWAAGYAWPPLVTDSDELMDPKVTDLVHRVGLHWYHDYNARPPSGSDSTEARTAGDTTSGVPYYQDAIRMKADLDLLQGVVVEGLADAGFVLERTVGEFAFPAAWPEGMEDAEIEAPYYEGATPTLQAAMLARLCVVLRASGIARACWNSPYQQPLNLDDSGNLTNWTSKIAATGLHNDLAAPGEYLNFAARGAWRRPAWFTFRRVAWLLSLASDQGTFVHNAKGLTLVRFTLRSRLTMLDQGQAGYRYLWFAWLDQYADDTCLHPTWVDSPSFPETDPNLGAPEADMFLYDTHGRGYEFVPLVPQVSEGGLGWPVDANGYRQSSFRRWRWEGWNDAVMDHGEQVLGSEDFHYAWFRLRKCETAVAQCPVAILTDASEGAAR